MDLVRVWPPTIIGRRKPPFIYYVHNPDAVSKLSLPGRFITEQSGAVWMKQITVEFVKCDQCPVYVFPPTMEGFIRAMYAGHHNGDDWEKANFPELSTGWHIEYATVGDMAVIDPHRKLVHWIPMHMSREINNHVVPCSWCRHVRLVHLNACQQFGRQIGRCRDLVQRD